MTRYHCETSQSNRTSVAISGAILNWRYQVSTESTGEISADLYAYSPPKYGPEDGPVAPQLGVPPGRWMDLDGKHHGKSDENLEDFWRYPDVRKLPYLCMY